MELKEKTIEERRLESLADPQVQAIIQKKADSAKKFLENLDWNKLPEDLRRLWESNATSKTPPNSPS